MSASVVSPVKSRPPSAHTAPSVRGIALRVLLEWSRQKQFAQDLLDAASREEKLTPPDAPFLHHISLSVLRNLTLLDHWIDAFSGGRHLDHRTRWVLRIGLAQLLLLDLPPHAAVNETVEIAGKARSFVNAILRRADRERDSLRDSLAALAVHIRTSHPGFLVHRWQSSYGRERAAELCEWNQYPAPVFIRVNPLHPDAASWLATASGLHDIGGGFHRCDAVPRDALAAGLCYAQDPSTAIAPAMLDPQAGDFVLDACAAPGGKTAILAAMMQNTGRIVAADSAAPRLQRLRDNLSRLRVTNAEVVQHDLTTNAAPPPWGDLLFDRILLDVPCTNTGVMRRRIDVRWRLSDADFAASATLQLRLLRTALRLLRPGGTLVYSTCSIDPEENRAVIDAALALHPSHKFLEDRLIFPPEARTDGAYAARLQAPLIAH